MKFILFYSKYLTNVENRYWFTKLKIVDLIWFIRRIKHIIEIFVKSSIIIYTNYFVIVFIIQQIKLSSSSMNKLNFRLIRVSIYLSQFFWMLNISQIINMLFRIFYRDYLSIRSNSLLIASCSMTFIKLTFIDKLYHNIFMLSTRRNIRNISSMKFISICRQNSKYRLWKVTNKTSHESKFWRCWSKKKIIVIRKRRQTTKTSTNIVATLQSTIVLITKIVVFTTNAISTIKSK